MNNRTLLASAACLLGVGGIILACSDDEAGAPATVDGGLDVSPPITPAPTTPDPGDADEDGGLITDGGGGNPDDEDGGLEIDAGVDGGVCGPATGNGAAVDSTCSTGRTRFAGGGIVAGSYDLTGFQVLGTAAFCKTYVPAGYVGRLDVTAQGVGSFVMGERTGRGGLVAGRPANRTVTATPALSTLNVKQSCGAVVDDLAWGYTSVLGLDGKVTLTYEHDTGTSIVRYRWKQR